MTSLFGVHVGRDQIGQAVVDLLQTPPAGSGYPLIVYALADVERDHGLTPRSLQAPQTFRTCLDWEVWSGADLPLIGVIAQPTGDAERYNDDDGEGVYGQMYEIQVAAIIEDPTSGSEATAIALADQYGEAIMLAVTQNGALGNPAAFTVEKTVLVNAPRTEFIPDAQRWLARSVVSFHTFVQQVVQETGPIVLGPDPYTPPADWPTITTVDVEFFTQKIDGTTGPQSGVTVTDSTGHVLVNE